MIYKRKFIEIKGYFNWFKLQKIPTHTISYLEFGDPQNQNILVCAHGLTRNAHDFDKIAGVLCDNFRIISINYPGRGASDYFVNKSHYNYYVYLNDTIKLLNALNIKNCFWLGTSMGGLIGMALASKYKNFIQGLIINDIGPNISKDVLNNINKHSRIQPIFDDLKNAKAYFKYIYNKFNIKDEDDWNHLTRHSLIKTAAGKYKIHYDLNIIPSKVLTKDIDIWSIYRRIYCVILLIHGVKSDILTLDIVNKMLKKPEVTLITVQDAGHAPALVNLNEIESIKRWLINKIRQ